MLINNPYAGAKMVLKNGDPIEQLRFGKSSENAFDKKDLMHSIGQMMMEASSGNIVQQRQVKNTPDRMKENQERREVLAAAFADKSGQSWTALGSSMATQINEQASREGFMRRLLLGNTLRQGEMARISMPTHDSLAVVATSPTNIGFQFVRGKLFQPDEFEVTANLRVDIMDIEQVQGDLLEHAYNEGLYSIMVKEDQLWKAAADMTVGINNPLQYIAGSLTPTILSTLRQTIAEWNLPVTSAIISNDYWTDITGSSDFGTLMDPITKYDLVLNGYLGTMIGMSLVTDAFRPPNQKVLERGEIYVLTSPEYTGAYSDRGGIRSTPTSGADQGNSTKGWFMNEIISLAITNTRSCVKAKRI